MCLGAILWWATRRRRSPVSWRNDPGTDRQRSFLADLGVSASRRATKGELSDLIDKALSQRGRRR
jgi:hypothetical protein